MPQQKSNTVSENKDASQALPWYRTTRRFGQTNLTEDDPLSCDLDFWRAQWRRTRVQGVIVNAGGIVAYYPSRFPLQHRAQGIDARDFFGDFIAAAREEGLKIVARMDINRAARDFFDAHPDWFSRHADGTPVMAQGRYVSCVNGPYYNEYIPAVLEEIIDRYRPDGFSDNNWRGLGRAAICYCANCRAAFKAATGFDLPTAPDWDDPVYRAWVRWGTERRTEIWDFFNEVTTRRGGPDCIWSGMVHGDPHNAGGALWDMRAIASRAKIIFTDHQARDNQNGFEQNGQLGALLRLAASDENILVPESMANYVARERAFRISANPPNETQMWMLSGIAGGISPWFHHIGGNRHDRRQHETPVPVMQWHAGHEEYLYDRVDCADIGLVWSQQNADLYGRDRAAERTLLPWRGFSRALTRARLPYLPIHAEDIARYAGRIKTLILPDIAVITDAQLDAVINFARNGGGLVLSGAAGTLDEDGRPRADNRLFKLLGLRFTGETAGAPAPEGGWDQYGSHNYLLLPGERHEIFSAFAETDILPFGGQLRVTVSDGPLKAVAGYVPPFPIFPPEFSYIRERRPDLGAVFAGELPGGGRAVYLAADIDRCLGRQGLPDHAALLAEAVLWTKRGKRIVTVNGPGLLDCRVYRQRDRLIIHVVNLSGCNAVGYCAESFPVGPVSVLVDASLGVYKNARLTVAGTEKFMSYGYPMRVVLDKVEQHEMVVLT